MPRHVSVEGETFTSIPLPHLGNLCTLGSLNISRCPNLIDLPQSLGSAPRLDTIQVELNSNLSSLPESLGSSEALRTLRAFNNQRLRALPQSLGSAPNLQTLDLQHNSRLTHLPESLSFSPHLVDLTVSDSRNLTSLPQSLGSAPNLAVLTARDNRNLTSLPQSLGHARRLRYLTVNGNRNLTSLPESLGINQTLRMIDARRCRITEFPRALFNCHPEAEILLSENPFSDQEINAVRAEIQHRRDNGIPTPMITLPEASSVNRQALANPENIIQNVVRDNGHAHMTVLTEYVTGILNVLIEKFPTTFVGTDEAQRNQLRAIQDQLARALTQHAKDHPEFDQGMQVASTMFKKGLGEEHEYVNDFVHTPGHVLAYVFTAMQAKWQAVSHRSERIKLQQQHLNAITTALTYFVREGELVPCDTRNTEELAQLVQIYDLALLPMSVTQIREIASPVVNHLLGTLMRRHPNANDGALQQHLRPLFLKSMRDKAPQASTQEINQFFQEHIIAAWDSLKELALDVEALQH